ncbi:uncharacterized protein [Hetaerina americana]|uniref:uncharacterized protein n=1 Tax=Hetaerina americana TaxID=62018 RepID=UPI003A7F54B4
MSQAQTIQPDATDQRDYDESLKNVAQGFIFPSSPSTSHEEIFKQLLAAGSQGPAPEPYVIPTAQSDKKSQPEAIIAIPQLTHAYIIEQPQLPVMAIINPNQQGNEPIHISPQTFNEEGGHQREVNSHHSSDMNAIQVESQYLQSKPSNYPTAEANHFNSELNGVSQRDQEVHLTSPFREEPSKIPLHPPPMIKASTYGPPQTVPTPFSTSQPKRPHPPNHRPSGPSRPPPQYQNAKGSSLHSKGPPKNRPPHNPYRLHSGPHSHHGHQHHHHQYHQGNPHHRYRETNHHPRPPPNHRPYDIHETKSVGPPHHSRPHTTHHSSSHKHPYNFHHHHALQKPVSGHSGPPKRPSSNSRPPNQHQEPHGKPPYRTNSQKGARPYGPPKTPSYGPPTSSNTIGSSHPGITKAIFHSTHSPDLTVNQNSGPIADLHGYTPGRYEYENEPISTTHSSISSYNTANHESRRPPDASPSASISEPYVTSPPRSTYPDEEDEEASPTVEVYSPLNDNFYGADSYQRMKQAFKPPVIVYKGVRPPVRVYQKPETGPPYHHLPMSHLIRGTTSNHLASHSYLPAIESTWANHNTASTPYYHQQRVRGSYSVASPSASSKSSDSPVQNVAEEIHLTTKAPFQYSPSSPSSGSSPPTDSLSSSSDDSSSWTPINAPAGAVPARAYHIPAPDLSRGDNQPINHHSSYYGSANSRADDEDLVLTEQNSNSNPSLAGSPYSSSSPLSGTGSSQLRRENNSEEVVSAVVLVKHR